MCGIFGVLSNKDKLTLAQERFIFDGTVVGQLRGDDGTGLLTVEKDGSSEVYKRAVTGADFYFSRLGVSAKRGVADAKLVIGHNRKGTSGGNGHVCCHPFPYDNVSGVHNGTIPWATLNRIKDQTEDTLAEVDSAKLYAALNKAKDPISVLEQVTPGSYALVWVNHKDGTLNFARNSDRPMWLANGTDGLYWASEFGMLYWLMSRHTLESDDSEAYQLDVNTLYSFNINNFAEVTKTAYSPKTPKYSHSSTQQNRSYANGYYNGRGAHGYADNSWINTAQEPVRTYRTINTMKLELPQMEEVADCLTDMVEDVQRQDTKLPRWGNFVDVIILMATYPGVRVEGRPDLWGVVQDTVESGLYIPVRLPAVEDKTWDILSRIPEDGDESKSFPTMRVEVNTIRVFAGGDVLLGATPRTVWDVDSDVAGGSYTTEAVGEVVNVWAERDRTYTSDQLKAMWAKLTKKS